LLPRRQTDYTSITASIVTTDAPHTQRGHVAYLIGRGAHYLLTVKDNQPSLLAQLSALPRDQRASRRPQHRHQPRPAGVPHRQRTTVAAGIGFPGAATAQQITRRSRRQSGKWHAETVYAITDLTVAQAGPAELADTARAHRGIENRLHWVRNVTFTEDPSQIRTSHGPAVTATLRTSPSACTAKTGATNIAAACPRLSPHPKRVPPLLV
jgi:predicted transposase YbfD/YdcC